MRLFLLFFILIYGDVVISQQMLSASQAKADLNQMVELVKQVHYNPFFLSDSNSFNNLHRFSLKRISQKDSMSITSFTLISMQLLAVINDAHTSINVVSPSLVPGLLKSDFFNLKLKFTNNEQIIVTSGPDSGKAIKSINEIVSNQLFTESIGCYGGNFNFRREITQSMFFPVFLHLEEIHSPFKIQYTDGSSAILKKGSNIQDLLASNGNDKPDYSFTIVKGDIGYMDYNRCIDPYKFADFLQKTFQAINEKGIHKLIIDIRKNSGGNSALNDMLLAYITQIPYRQSGTRYWKVSDIFKDKITEPEYKSMWGKRFVKQYRRAQTGSILKEDQYSLIQPKKVTNYFDGEVCLLIGPQTFSSANFLADAVATYSLFPLIGKSTGENTNDFGEQITIPLNNSQLELQVSIAYDIGADGDVNRIETVAPTIYSEGDALDFAINWLLNKENN
ncbi:MAG: hypothetical protein ACI85Q_001204 [Salibacteraceae bacterium]|jgi:hypothetical protein